MIIKEDKLKKSVDVAMDYITGYADEVHQDDIDNQDSEEEQDDESDDDYDDPYNSKKWKGSPIVHDIRDNIIAIKKFLCIIVSFPCFDMDFRSNYLRIHRSYTYGCMCPFESLMNKLYESGLEDFVKRNFLCKKKHVKEICFPEVIL